MPQPKKQRIPILRVKKGDSLRTIYAKARRALTAADLQKYTEIEEGFPAVELLAELEAIDQRESRKHKGKPRKSWSR